MLKLVVPKVYTQVNFISEIIWCSTTDLSNYILELRWLRCFFFFQQRLGIDTNSTVKVMSP